MSSKEQFIDLAREGILSLAQDMKSMLRIVEDPDIDDESRVEASGALLHVLSASNAIPGLRGKLAYVDDVLVLRLVLQRIARRSPDAIARHRDEAPELVGALEEQLAVMRAFLGDDLVAVLEKAVDGVSKLNHQGHTAEQCAHDSTWLYESVQEAIVDMDFDEDEIARLAKSVDEILPPLRLKARS